MAYVVVQWLGDHREQPADDALSLIEISSRPQAAAVNASAMAWPVASEAAR